MTKSDAVPPAVVAEAVKAVEGVANGVSIVVVSSTAGGGMVDLAPYLVAGRTVALLGVVGSGEVDAGQPVGGWGHLGDGRGTQRRKWTSYDDPPRAGRVARGGLLIDTPGMRALSVEGAGGGVALAFGDIEEMAQGCEYAGCSHTGEIGCALLAALNRGSLDRGRFESWLRLRAEPASVEIDATRRGIEERKRRKAKKVADRRAART
jgi:ribosome biogenesis GTPase